MISQNGREINFVRAVKTLLFLLLFQTLCNKMGIHNVICFQYYSPHSSKNKQKPKQERQIDACEHVEN